MIQRNFILQTIFNEVGEIIYLYFEKLVCILLPCLPAMTFEAILSTTLLITHLDFHNRVNGIYSPWFLSHAEGKRRLERLCRC